MRSPKCSLTRAALLGMAGVLTLLPGCATRTSSAYNNPSGLFREIGYADAVQLSAHQKKPMFLFFTDNWVKDREKLLSRTLSSASTLQLLNDRTIGLQIEVSDLPDVARKHKVTSAPAIVLVGPNGHELKRWRSLPKAESFEKEITQIMDTAEKERQVAGVNTPALDH